MTRLRIGQKALKTGTLLIGLRDARIAQALRPLGFDEATLKEGWELFREVTEQRLSRDIPVAKNPETVQDIDRFENEWFPLAQLILTRRYPQILEELFANLTREDGKSTAFSVSVFLRRLSAMKEGSEPFTQEGKEAYQYLISRGLTEEILGKVRAQLETLEGMENAALPEDEATAEQRAKAEDAMWAWYLEWSGIARRVIDNGNLLRMLGFKKRKFQNGAGEEEEVIETLNPGEVRVLPQSRPLLALPAE